MPISDVVTEPTRSRRIKQRLFLGALLLLGLLAVLVFSRESYAATPGAGSVSASSPTANWSGTTAGVSTDTTTCVYGVNCDSYKLTVNNSAGYDLDVRIQWPLVADDLDLYVCQGTDASPCQTIIANSGNSATTAEEVNLSHPASGLYYIVAVNFAGATTYTGTATLAQAAATPTPVPFSGTEPRFQNFASPDGLGEDAGEPSIGSNWKTDRVMYQAGLQTLRVTFAITCTCATWEDKSFATTSAETLDPIMFTDSRTGRTIVSQLTGLDSLSAYTDDDGDTYTPSQGGGIPSGVDHQTLGGGPYAPSAILPAPTAVYTHAVYYCSQSIAAAFCARSDTGGLTFGAGVPIYNLTDCSGIHGHVKVSPNDGTVYVPNKSCNGEQAAVVSSDNGTTWAVRRIPGSTAGDTDPSIGIGLDGTVYEGMQSADGHPRVAVSTDKGVTWSAPVDVGVRYGIQNSVFPAVVAGDGNRAAFAFLGTPEGGNYQDEVNFNGIWHLYIATTYDRGVSWITVDATPNDPVQRGSICTAGTTCGSDRNLLDFFDATVDKEGRTLIGYADGCIDSCVNNPPNSATAKATIARQSGGPRLFAAFDPTEPALPGAPFVTATESNNKVHLEWTAPDDGGSPITHYNVYRSTNPDSGFVKIASVTTTSYDDTNIQPNTTYYYRVTAVNAVGEGPFCPAVAAVASVTANPCITPGALVIEDDDDEAPNIPADPRVDIDNLYVAEPYSGGVDKLLFTLNVGATPITSTNAPPNSQWYIIWNSVAVPADPNYDREYVAMKSDATGAVSFEYGMVTCPATGCLPGNVATKVGDADSGTYDPATGAITILISDSNIQNIHAGQDLAGLQVRTFFGRNCPVSGCDLPITQTISSDYTPYGEYTLVGSAACAADAGTGTPATTTTAVASGTTTGTAIASGTATRTAVTGTGTATRTGTVVASGTATRTGTAVASGTTTRTTTGTATRTSVTGTATRTAVASSTAGASGTTTTTTTGTATRTSVTNTATRTSVATSSSTAVATGTATRTSVTTGTATRTAVASGTTTSTAVASGTASRTSTAVSTGTAVSSATATRTGSVTPSVIASSTSVATGTSTAMATTTGTTVATQTSVTTATLPAATSTVSATPCAISFTDVQSSDYFHDGVLYLTCHGAISGYADKTFRPYNTTTRAQLVKIIVLAEGFPLINPAQATFRDVPTTFPFYNYIETAVQRQIIAGYSDQTFRPYNEVTRGQITKIIVLAEGWSLVNPTQPTYHDVPRDNPFYTFIETASQHGVISGYDGAVFRPGNSATRGQIAKIVYLAVTGP